MIEFIASRSLLRQSLSKTAAEIHQLLHTDSLIQMAKMSSFIPKVLRNYAPESISKDCVLTGSSLCILMKLVSKSIKNWFYESSRARVITVLKNLKIKVILKIDVVRLKRRRGFIKGDRRYDCLVIKRNGHRLALLFGSC
jgi:hypothetical protein